MAVSEQPQRKPTGITDAALEAAPFVDVVTDVIPYPELSDWELRMRVLERDPEAIEEVLRRNHEQ